MTSFFTSRSPLTDAIDRATSDEHPVDDIPLHLEICDIINETESGAKDAAKHLKKKLTSKASNPSILRMILLLDSCMKNCGRRFHAQVITQDFLQVLHRTVLRQPPISNAARDKLLSMIQSWADTFRGDVSMRVIQDVYADLKQHVEFPPQDMDSMSPILTPEASVTPMPSARPYPANSPAAPSPSPSATLSRAPQRTMSQMEADEAYARELDAQFREADAAETQPHPPRNPPPPSQHGGTHFPPDAHDAVEYYDRVVTVPAGERVRATTEQAHKLRRDLAVVKSNTAMLDEVVGHTGPSERLADNGFGKDVFDTCKEMRARCFQLIDTITNEDIMSEVLEAIDGLNGVLQRYDLRLRQDAPRAAAAAAAAPTAIPSAAAYKAPTPTPASAYKPTPAPTPTPAPAPAPAAPRDLIDLSEPAVAPSRVAVELPPYSVDDQLRTLRVDGAHGGASHTEDEFDMFGQLQSAPSFAEQRAQSAAYVTEDDQPTMTLGEALAKNKRGAGTMEMMAPQYQPQYQPQQQKPQYTPSQPSYTPPPQAAPAAAAPKAPAVASGYLSDPLLDEPDAMEDAPLLTIKPRAGASGASGAKTAGGFDSDFHVLDASELPSVPKEAPGSSRNKTVASAVKGKRKEELDSVDNDMFAL